MPTNRNLTNPSDDLEAAGKHPSQLYGSILKIYDAPFDGSVPQSCAEFRFGDIVKELSAHRPATARIFDFTVDSKLKWYAPESVSIWTIVSNFLGYSDSMYTDFNESTYRHTLSTARCVFREILHELYAQPIEECQLFRWLDVPSRMNDIGSISSQWSQSLGDTEVRPYHIMNRASLQQHPLTPDVRPRNSYMTCMQDGTGRLSVLIVNDVDSEQDFGVGNLSATRIHFTNPRCIESMVAGKSWTSLSDGSLDTFVKLFILDFLSASVYLQPIDHYSRLLYPQFPKNGISISPITNYQLKLPLGLVDSHLDAKSADAFMQNAEDILWNVENLIDSVDFVVRSLRRSSLASPQHKRNSIYQRRTQELQERCSERLKNILRSREAFKRQQDYQTKRHIFTEEKSVKVITILAAIYLPLSLSASLLSMQSPFKQVATDRRADGALDLTGTNLLVDFIGVSIVLATFTSLIVITIQFALWMNALRRRFVAETLAMPFSRSGYDTHWRFYGRAGHMFTIMRLLLTLWPRGMVLTSLSAILLVHMLRKDSYEGYLAAILFNLEGVAYCFIRAVYHWSYWRVLKKRSKIR